MGVIRFKINYEVSKKENFKNFLDNYQSEVGLEIHDLKIERYWKIQEQFQAMFSVYNNSNEKERSIYEVLRLANQLQDTSDLNWTINGPHENGALVFECILNNLKDGQPLKWAHIELEIE